MKRKTVEFLSAIVVIALFVSLCFIEGCDANRRSFHFVESMRDVQEHTVLEGDTVDLICPEPSSAETVGIEGLHAVAYVTNGVLTPRFLNDNITFTKQNSSVVLTFNKVKRNNTDEFICRTPRKYLILKVLYSPTDYPLLTTGYEPQVFINDNIQGPYQFNCTTEEGDPPVDISLYIEKDGRKQQVNSADYNITQENNLKSLSFVTYLNSSFNDARLVCSVTQQLPDPYQNYQKYCFFEISPQVSVNIHPSNYTITMEGEIITLTCTSNVSGVVLKWTDIPLEESQYNINRINDSLQLVIFNYGSNINGSISLQCNGSYGGRVISRNVSIRHAYYSGEQVPSLSGQKANWLSPALVIVCSLAVFIFVIIPAVIFVILVVIKVYRNRKGNKIPSVEKPEDVDRDTPTPTSTNENNGNNIESDLTNKGESLTNSEAAGNDEENTEMVNNPIYDKNTNENKIQKTTTFDDVSDRSNSIIEMTENVSYESYKPRIEVDVNEVDDGYATVNI